MIHNGFVTTGTLDERSARRQLVQDKLCATNRRYSNEIYIWIQVSYASSSFRGNLAVRLLVIKLRFVDFPRTTFR